MSCPNGLLFDAEQCVIVRDTYRSLDVDSLEEDGRVMTERLLARVPAAGPTLDRRVLEWLNDVAAPFITDMVRAKWRDRTGFAYVNRS